MQYTCAYFNKPNMTLDEAQSKIAAAYGLSEAFPDLTSFDPIALAYSATSQEQAEAALTAQARNIMVSTLGDTSKKVAEYFTTEIAPVVRTQITDLLILIRKSILQYIVLNANILVLNKFFY